MVFYCDIKLFVYEKSLFISNGSFSKRHTFCTGKKADVDININKDSDGGSFWGSPVMWIIGAAVFIILLVAVSRGSSTSK